jgi:Domain of unknown function (DUF4214)/Putative Ig domain/Ig-like domain from next to BRCA1 gene/Matrixin
MERVLKQAGAKSLILVFSILAVAQSALATTAIMPSDDEMIVGARAIVRGKVLSVEVGLDGQNLVFTYITLKIKEVLKGQITERKIVIKEPGGEIGNRGSLVFGTPQFARGDRVLLYLDTWQDGSLRVHQMFLGRFSIVQEDGSGELMVTRNLPERGVSILGQSDKGSITNRMELNQYAEMVRTRLAANLEHSREFEAGAYGSTPMLAQPLEYKETDGGDISPQFHLWSPPIRWFQPDSGQSVVFKTNPAGAPTPQSVADAAAAMGAWSTVPGCALRVSDGGTTQGCGLFGLDGENTISFNNCDGYFTGTGTCSSGILAVASIASYDPSQTRVVNGVSFAKALESNITFNPFSACNFGDHCNVQEITTHEMGHALGLHHSWQSSFGGTPTAAEQQATMYWIAHFDGRCASLRTDDINGITFIYPSAGGGPGPLTIVTSALTGGTVGAAYSQSISASGGTLPYAWSLVAGLGTLPPGLNLSAGGVITGTPTTEGTYNFTVRVTDNVGATVQKALGIVVAAAGGGGPLNSQFVSQSVPTSLQPGQGFTVNMKFQNTGTQTWSGTAYYFASQNPPLNQNWGGNGVSLLGFSAAPGEVLDVNFTATAPTTPGTYNFQWQMYQNGGVGFFGQVSTNVSIQVGSPPPPPPPPGADTDTDGIPDAVEPTVGKNPNVKDNDIFNEVLLFAMQQYRDFLGREGDSGGINFWTNYLNTGSGTRAQVIDNFFNSPEFQGTASPVTRLYFAYFLRIPDYEGLLFWVNQYRQGATLDSISQGFAGSAEFQSTYGSLNNTQFVTLLYQNVLGRAPDAGGLAFWVGQLNSGVTRGSVMLGFSESPEYKQASYNKVYVTMIYVGMLRRAPEQGGFDFWVNQMNGGASGLGLIQGFLAAPEYHNRFMP